MSHSLLDIGGSIYLANVSLASLLVCGIALIAAVVNRRRSLPLQHALLSVAVALTLVCPLAVWVASSLGFGAVPLTISTNDTALDWQTVESVTSVGASSGVRPGEVPTVAFPQDRGRGEVPLSSAESMSEDFAAAIPVSRSNGDLAIAVLQLLAIGWIIGTAVVLIRLLRGMLVVLRLRRSLRPVERVRLLDATRLACESAGLRREVAICESSLAPAPLSLGLWRPTIVLPEGLDGRLSDRHLLCVLSHEAAHVVRRDGLIALLQRLASIGFWWNPFFHAIDRRLSRLREQICDDYVVSSQGTGVSLAEAIVNVAEWCTVPRVSLPGVGTLLDHGDELDARITRLTHRENTMNLRLNWKTKCVCGLFTLLLFAMLVIPATRAEPDDSPPAAGIVSNTLQLDYVPPDSMFVLALRPTELLGESQRRVVQALVEIRGAEYEQLTFVQRKAPPEGRTYLAFDADIVRAKKAVIWKDIVTEKNGIQLVEHEYEGHSYNVASQLRNVAAYQADDRTLLVAPLWHLKPMMARGKGERSDFPWADAWRELAHRPLAIFMEGAYGREQLKSLVATGLGTEFAETFAPLWEDIRWVIVSISADAPMEIEIAATYGSAEAGRRAYVTAAGLLILARDEIEQIREQAKDSTSGSTADRLKMAVLAEEFVENALVSRRGAEIRLRTTSNFEVGSFLSELHRFATRSKRKAAAIRSD